MASALIQTRVLILLESVAAVERSGRVCTSVEIAFVLGTGGHSDLLNSVRERLLTTARQAGLLKSRAGIWSLTSAGRAALAAGRVELP
jgi:hypothetical protein